MHHVAHDHLASETLSRHIGAHIVEDSSAVHLFHVGHHRMCGRNLAQVGRLVQQGKIKVVLLADGKGRCAGFVANREGVGYLCLARSRLHGSTGRGIALHEATHASFMLRGTQYHVDALVDEALAFIVEAMYRERHGDLASEYAGDPMLSAAHKVAQEIRNSHHADHVSVNRLKTALLENGYIEWAANLQADRVMFSPAGGA